MQKKLIPAYVGCIGLAASATTLADHRKDFEIPFAVAQIFFELNNTDGDLGIHALIDGEPWKRLSIEDSRERRLLNIGVRGRLRRQGLTEIFFESAEPPFDELPPTVFFRRFPEGTYEIEGMTLDGRELESESEITHAMPAPPEPRVNGQPMATKCDDEETDYAPTVASNPVVIAWPAVTTTHPSLGAPRNSSNINIYNYEVVVETDLEIDGEEFTTVFSAVIPPGVTSVSVPAEFTAQSDTFKFEVLAREQSWNQTAVESCFVIE